MHIYISNNMPVYKIDQFSSFYRNIDCYYVMLGIAINKANPSFVFI